MPALKEFSLAVRHVWACHEAFRRIGYSADHIYAAAARSAEMHGMLCAFSVLKIPERPEFWVCCATIASQEEFHEEWTRFAELANVGAFAHDEMMDAYFGCPHIFPAPLFVQALLRKGIPLPGMAMPIEQAQAIATELLETRNEGGKPS